MKKRLIISETKLRSLVRRVINEAMKSSFSVEALNQAIQLDLQKYQAAKEKVGMGAANDTVIFENTINYCDQHFGEALEAGSSRIVYQIDDTRVIKLAWNGKGIAQNRAEYVSYNSSKCKSLQAIVFNDSDTQNFYYIIQEFALPAEQDDFRNLLKIDWKIVVQFATALVKQNYRDANQILEYLEQNNNPKAHKLMEDLFRLSELENHLPGDFGVIRNWGLVKRNGQATLILVDNGLTDEVGNNFYGIYR